MIVRELQNLLRLALRFGWIIIISGSSLLGWMDYLVTSS
jgi:hypothetical protein